jgi:hypothetical protein
MFYLIQRFFFDKFSPLGDKKKNNVTHTKYFCEKDLQEFAIFRRFFFLKLPYLDNMFH